MKSLSTGKIKDLIYRLPKANEYEYNTYIFELLPDIEYSVKMMPKEQQEMIPVVVKFIKVKTPIQNKYEWAMEI